MGDRLERHAKDNNKSNKKNILSEVWPPLWQLRSCFGIKIQVPPCRFATTYRRPPSLNLSTGYGSGHPLLLQQFLPISPSRPLAGTTYPPEQAEQPLYPWTISHQYTYFQTNLNVNCKIPFKYQKNIHETQVNSMQFQWQSFVVNKIKLSYL